MTFMLVIASVANQTQRRVAPAPSGGGGAGPWTGTVRTTDGSVADVQAKINAASTGDIIEIPAGSFAWSTGITNNKGILIRGAGSGRVLGYHNASSVSIGTGTKVFTVNEVPTQAGTITASMTLRIWLLGGERNSGGSGTGQKPWMEGTVTSYSGGTLTMNITSTSGHSLTKRLWIITTNATTTITNNTGSTGRLMELTENVTLPTGVTGIRFEGGTVSNNANHVHILPTTNGKPIHVYNNWIGIEGAMIAVETTGVNRGLIYNNSVARFNWLNSVGECLKVTGPSNSWTTTSTMGSADTDGLQNVYFEDNDIHAMVTTVDIDDYGRACIRYNLCNESPMGGSHGADTSNFGVRHGEFNHNTFVFTEVGGSPDLETFDLNRWILLRGGTGTVYANTMPNITSTAWGNKDEIQLQIQNLDRNAGPNACWGANIGGSQYPCPRQIGMGYVTGSGTDGLGRSSDGYTYVGDSEPMYIWSNTGSPSISVLTGYEGASECTNPDAASTYIQASRDYFTSAKPGYTEHTYPNELRVD